jgi:hypothetical protein
MLQRRFIENSEQLFDSNPTSMLKSASVSAQALVYFLVIFSSNAFIYGEIS